MGFNFPDVKDTDVLAPIIINDEIKVNPYNPEFHLEGLSVSGTVRSLQSDTRVEVSVDNYESILDEDVPDTAGATFFLNEAGHQPVVENGNWKSPNEFNDIGLTFKIGNPEVAATHEVEIESYVKEPVLTN